MRKMDGRLVANFLALAGLAVLSTANATPVFINELHYDNAGRDQLEGVEVVAPAAGDLMGWVIQLYNGADGRPYRALPLDGAARVTKDGVDFIWVETTLQNGPDGIALSDAQGEVVDFLSYEAEFEAFEGVAAGLTSELIGAVEGGATPVGFSIQRRGEGQTRDDFGWSPAPIESTWQGPNREQTFAVFSTPAEPVPIGSTAMLTAIGCLTLGWHRLRRGRRGAHA